MALYCEALVLVLVAASLCRERPSIMHTAQAPTHRASRPVGGIMWVIFDHLRPPGHIMPDHGGDRGAVFAGSGASRSPPYQTIEDVHPGSAMHKHTARLPDFHAADYAKSA